MFNEKTVPGPEYRVRTVVRYVVTRYCHPYLSDDGRTGNSGCSTAVGEFQNEQQAFDVANALTKADAYAGAAVSV